MVEGGFVGLYGHSARYSSSQSRWRHATWMSSAVSPQAATPMGFVISSYARFRKRPDAPRNPSTIAGMKNPRGTHNGSSLGSAMGLARDVDTKGSNEGCAGMGAAEPSC